MYQEYLVKIQYNTRILFVFFDPVWVNMPSQGKVGSEREECRL